MSSYFDTVANAFNANGVLAGANPQFKPRTGQTDMAMAVAETIASGGELVVEAGTVWVLDFKSDEDVPTDSAQVPAPYRTQLALYALAAGQLFPGSAVRAAILWTSLESLLELPGDVLAEAARGFTLR